MIASPICQPIRLTGFSVCSAPWKTIASSVQRTARNRSGASVSTSSPLSSTSPVTSVPCGSRRRSAPATVDLPQPDSPAMPSVSPRSRSKSTPRTAGTAAAAGPVGDAEVAHREQRRGHDRRPRNRGSRTSSSAWPTSVNASTTSTMPMPGGR